MRTSRFVAGVAALPAALLLTAVAAPAAPAAPGGQATEYTVLVEAGASPDAAREAVRAAGGRVTAENLAVGTLTVAAPDGGFAAAVAGSPAVFGAARVRPIGQTPDVGTPRGEDERAEVEQENRDRARPAPAPREAAPNAGADARPAAPGPATAGLDPLDEQLWGLSMVRSHLARDRQAGDRGVMVGIIDSGIDGSHPDLAPNLDERLSRNFTRDIPSVGGVEIDGPCEYRGCVDPADVDDNGHGSHVAGTVAAAANGAGLSGVAPNVTLVNVRAGQDSGYFFLQPTVDALTYGADVGLDVVNMSFYVDPWLYNCTANPEDTPEEQQEQRTIIEAMSRALEYAHGKGVALVGSLGNNHEDLGKPRTDTSSPDFPPGSESPRPIDNASCFDLPVEGPHVIGVSALGPSGTKADYSNYGVEQVTVSAPGGFFRDFAGTPWSRTNENLILSAYPRTVALAEGAINAEGVITPDGAAAGVQRAEFPDGSVGYYQYLQGTSMASPHVSGVLALIVSEYGTGDRQHRGTLAMDPVAAEAVLVGTAQATPCPTPPLQSYASADRPAEFDALCEGDERFNGFYGHGIADAFGAVTRGDEVLVGRP